PDAWSRIHETPEYAAALAEVDAQIAGKPESAEAVVWRGRSMGGSWTYIDKPHPADVATGFWEPLFAAPPRPEASDPHVATIQRPGWPRRDSAVYFTMEHAAYDFPPGTLLYATPQQASAPVGVEASQLADELEAWAKEPFVALTPMRRM